MSYATHTELFESFKSASDCQCDSCGFKTTKLNRYKDHCERSKDAMWTDVFFFCDVCFSTFTGNAHRYPSQYPDAEVMKLVAYCTNLIIKTIKEKL